MVFTGSIYNVGKYKKLNGSKTNTICVIFQFLITFHTIVGAGTASRYSSGFDQMMWLLAVPVPCDSGSATQELKHWCENEIVGVGTAG
jgi:hypothetical protein